MSDDLEALRIDAAATFGLTAEGRIGFENEPSPSAGPRLWVGGCAGGQVVLARADVAGAVAARAAELAAEPWPDLEGRIRGWVIWRPCFRRPWSAGR